MLPHHIELLSILRDDELEPARKLAWQLYDAGVDALIIQDMGLLEIDLPPIQLHASTQTDIRTPEKARFLRDAPGRSSRPRPTRKTRSPTSPT